MKKLTIEEKARRYDEAISHAKTLLKIIGNATLGNLVLKNEFKRMFPELVESENEMIRKSLIDYFEDFHLQTFAGLDPKKILAWLKSQNHWKPSEGQMASITCAVRKMKESTCYDSELVSLFNDLKKL